MGAEVVVVVEAGARGHEQAIAEAALVFEIVAILIAAGVGTAVVHGLLLPLRAVDQPQVIAVAEVPQVADALQGSPGPKTGLPIREKFAVGIVAGVGKLVLEAACPVVAGQPPGLLFVFVPAAIGGFEGVYRIAVVVAVVAVHVPAHQGETQRLGGLVADAGVDRTVIVTVVVPDYSVGAACVESVVAVIGTGQVEIHGIVAAADVTRELLCPVAAALGTHLAAEAVAGGDGGNVDHAAGVAAVHQPLGAAQDLHPLHAGTQQLPEARAHLWAGSVGYIDAVQQHQGTIAFLAANAQGRGAARTPGIGDGDTRLGAQHVIQRDKTQPLDLLLVDHGNRGAHLAQGHFYPGGGHDDLFQHVVGEGGLTGAGACQGKHCAR